MRKGSLMCAMVMLLIGVWGSAWAQLTADEFDAGTNAHNVDQMMATFTDDYVWDPVSIAPMNKEASKVFFTGLFQAFPDFHVTQTRVLSSGNILVIEHLTTGTQLGDWDLGAFGKIPATGKSFTTFHMDIAEFEGNKAKRIATYDDMLSMFMQLGVMPAGELPPLVPSFTLPDPEPTGLAPLEAQAEGMSRWNTHDMAFWAKMIRPDADIFYNVLGIPIDRDALIALNEIYFLGFPDIQGEIMRMIDMGDGWVVNEAVFNGTHDGPYFGIPATGNPMTNRVAWIARFDADGMITYFHVYFDNLTVLVQIGAIPGPTSVLPTTWGQIKATFQE